MYIPAWGYAAGYALHMYKKRHIFQPYALGYALALFGPVLMPVLTPPGGTANAFNIWICRGYAVTETEHGLCF